MFNEKKKLLADNRRLHAEVLKLTGLLEVEQKRVEYAMDRGNRHCNNVDAVKKELAAITERAFKLAEEVVKLNSSKVTITNKN